MIDLATTYPVTAMQSAWRAAADVIEADAIDAGYDPDASRETTRYAQWLCDLADTIRADAGQVYSIDFRVTIPFDDEEEAHVARHYLRCAIAANKRIA